MTVKKFEGGDSAEVLGAAAIHLLSLAQSDLTSLGNVIRADDESQDFIEATVVTCIATAAMDLLARRIFECGGNQDTFTEAVKMASGEPVRRLGHALTTAKEIRSGKESKHSKARSNDIAAGTKAANEFMKTIIDNAKKG